MKYLRKISALLIGVIFFAALVICVGKIFAIKNVNVTLITYADEEEYTISYEKAKSSLGTFKGESILFLSTDDIVDALSGSNYTVTSCEKKYPCTVNVVLSERLETYAVVVGGLYSMYDNNGKYLRSSVDNFNVNDGTPNVELTGIAVEKIADIAEIAKTFKEIFGSLRSIVAGISLDTNDVIEGYTDKLNFNLRCGLKIQFDDYTQFTEEKIRMAYAKYCTLSDRQKLNGTLRSYRIGGEEGVVNADYSPIK